MLAASVTNGSPSRVIWRDTIAFILGKRCTNAHSVARLYDDMFYRDYNDKPISRYRLPPTSCYDIVGQTVPTISRRRHQHTSPDLF